MKKLLILFLLITPCFAFDYGNYCSTENHSKTFSGVLMSATGTNLLARIIAQNKIADALKKETGSKFNVKIGLFWGTNISQGEFSGFTATSKNFSHKNFSAQKLTVETVCPYNKISYKNDKLNFDTNMVLKFNAQMNENDLSQLLKQKVQLIDDKVFLRIKMSAFGIKTSFKIKAGLEVENNKIKLCNIELNNRSHDASKYSGLLNELINFRVSLDKNIKADVKIDNIKIKDSLSYLSGYVLIPKN